MCERDGEREAGETRDESRRSEPSPAEETERAAASAEPKKLADSWGERVGYGF